MSMPSCSHRDAWDLQVDSFLPRADVALKESLELQVSSVRRKGFRSVFEQASVTIQLKGDLISLV